MGGSYGKVTPQSIVEADDDVAVVALIATDAGVDPRTIRGDLQVAHVAVESIRDAAKLMTGATGLSPGGQTPEPDPEVPITEEHPLAAVVEVLNEWTEITAEMKRTVGAMPSDVDMPALLTAGQEAVFLRVGKDHYETATFVRYVTRGKDEIGYIAQDDHGQLNAIAAKESH